MTPTPEMIAMAERIGEASVKLALDQGMDEVYAEMTSDIAKHAALTAIMEVQQRVERELDKCCDPCPQCHDAIRNGEVSMILCPTCGNKRCPKATNHRNTCTGSNEEGQRGSRYRRLSHDH